MADLEQDKDLEEDEFKSNAKPTSSRTIATRICNRNVKYQSELDQSDDHEDTNDDDGDSEKEDVEAEESSDDCDQNDGYSSPDIDYESLTCYD